MQKHYFVYLVDLVKSFPTNIYLQNLASIQKRTSPVKFAHLAEKSGKGSISNLSTKVLGPLTAGAEEREGAEGQWRGGGGRAEEAADLGLLGPALRAPRRHPQRRAERGRPARPD